MIFQLAFNVRICEVAAGLFRPFNQAYRGVIEIIADTGEFKFFRGRVGLVHEEHTLPPWMSVAALVAIALVGAFFLPWQQGVAVGMILALSSTAIVLSTLREKGLMNTSPGQSICSVLLFQDLAVIPVLLAFYDDAGHQGLPETLIVLDSPEPEVVWETYQLSTAHGAPPPSRGALQQGRWQWRSQQI